MTSRTLQPGTLSERLARATEHGLRCGALQPIATGQAIVQQGGVRFIVRILARIEHKERARREQDDSAAVSGSEFNPFLPFDGDLFVCDVSETHVGLLNKFNVLDRHLLVVTRDFEDQDAPLTLQDFDALWRCVAEFEGLAFYNGGTVAGASQRHKHLQMVPLPLVPGGTGLPIDPLLASVRFDGKLGKAPDLPFAHSVARVNPRWLESPASASAETFEIYHSMLGALGLKLDGVMHPYNLLLTRKWMLLVPRTSECYESISINALGFAGALLVRDERRLRILRERGPLTALTRVAGTRYSA